MGLEQVEDLFLSFLCYKFTFNFESFICSQKVLHLSGEIVFMPITLIRPYSNLEYPDTEQNKNCKPMIDLVIQMFETI